MVPPRLGLGVLAAGERNAHCSGLGFPPSKGPIPPVSQADPARLPTLPYSFPSTSTLLLISSFYYPLTEVRQTS